MSSMLPGILTSGASTVIGLALVALTWQWCSHLKHMEKKCVCVVYDMYIHIGNRTQTHTFWSKFDKFKILHEPPKHAKPPKPSFSKFSDFKAMVKADPGLSSGKMRMFDGQIGCHRFLQRTSGSVTWCMLSVSGWQNLILLIICES